MAKTEKKPLSDIEEIKPTDTSGMSIEQRLYRLEQITHTLAAHQISLGSSLITLHTKVMEICEAANAVAQESGEIVAPRLAPLITPGGHPLRKG